MKISNPDMPVESNKNAADLYSHGLVCENGQGFGQNYALAVRLYRLAAKQGYTAAKSRLAKMYKDGTGVTQDNAQALKWLILAAMNVDNSDWLATDRDVFAKTLTAEQVAEAERLAYECIATNFRDCN